jgi:hypothetical protein
LPKRVQAVSYPKFAIESISMSELNEDFEKILVLLNGRLKEAAVCLREANRFREKLGFPTLVYSVWLQQEEYHQIYKRLDESGEYPNDQDLEKAIEAALEVRRNQFDRFNTNDLECEMQRAGWSTSSSYC